VFVRVKHLQKVVGDSIRIQNLVFDKLRIGPSSGRVGITESTRKDNSLHPSRVAIRARTKRHIKRTESIVVPSLMHLEVPIESRRVSRDDELEYFPLKISYSVRYHLRIGTALTGEAIPIISRSGYTSAIEGGYLPIVMASVGGRHSVRSKSRSTVVKIKLNVVNGIRRVAEVGNVNFHESCDNVYAWV
jgi:hypothetical protein